MNPFTRLFGIATKQTPLQQEPSKQQQPPAERKRLPHLHRLKDRKPAFQLQDRDVEILVAVLENRFLTAALLKLLFPPDKAKTPPHVFTDNPTRSGTNVDRRLSKLFHHGYLQRIRTEINGHLYYALTSKGAQLIADRQLPLPFTVTLLTDWEEKNRDLSHHYLEHATMVACFHTALICGTREHSSIQLVHYEREGEGIKEEWRKRKQPVLIYPDAFCMLQDTTSNQSTPYFLEADQSTMRLHRLLDKFKRYALLAQNRHAYGLEPFRVLTVCKSAERARNILKLAAAETSPISPKLKKQFFFTTEERYKDALPNICAEIWWRADECNPSIEDKDEEPAPLRSVLRADPLRRL